MSQQYSDEFVKAGLLAGYLAGAIENYFHDDEFFERLRVVGMDITFEYVEQMKAEAVAKGMPAELLQLPPHIEEMLFSPEVLQFGREMQAIRDKQVEGWLSRGIN